MVIMNKIYYVISKYWLYYINININIRKNLLMFEQVDIREI